MGYTTDFRGQFDLNKPLTEKLKTFLEVLACTRRMSRNVEGYGVEGEFHAVDDGNYGQDEDRSVVNSNSPPSTQPSLWLQWVPNEDGTAIEWDGGEKFYEYTAWIIYLIQKILKPNGYVLDGTVEYRGEEWEDTGEIYVENNIVYLNQSSNLYRQEPSEAMQIDITYKL